MRNRRGAAKSAAKPKSIAGTGRRLSALARAEKLGEVARRAGMDWSDVREVIAKVREELDEIDAALARADHTAAAEEIGDLMLAISNAPRFIGHGAERTLHRACEKFAARFDSAVRLANARGLKLKLMTPAGLEALWQEAKKLPPGRANRSR